MSTSPFESLPLVLGSRSPRRAQLLQQLGFSFRQISTDVEEHYPPELEGPAIAAHLAELKSRALREQVREGELLLTSDTVVWCQGVHLAKAADASEARAMLRQLSGQEHEVITGLSLWSSRNAVTITDTTRVTFRVLQDWEIEYYLQHYQPYDKAGAYGIQEWIGMSGISAIKGSYFTVMGLPTHRLMEELQHQEF